jgi:hypothetical protein
MNHKPIRIKYTSRGLIAVMQCAVHRATITYNPDDERFYVDDSNDNTRATFAGNAKGFQNAIQYARCMEQFKPALY